MSISLAESLLKQMAVPLIFAAAALIVAACLGAFRCSNVIGPRRLSDRAATPGLLWIITTAGMFVWLVTSNAVVSSDGRVASSATQPTTAATTASTFPTIPSSEENRPLSAKTIVLASTVPPIVGFLAFLLADVFALGSREPSLVSQLGYPIRRIGRGVLTGLLGAIVAVPLTLAVSIITQLFVERLGMTMPVDHELIRIFRDPEDHGLRSVIALSAILVAPLFEELFFRGHLQTVLAATFAGARREPVPGAFARWAAIAGSAALFAAVHWPGWMRPPLFVLAICIGYVYERTGNLWAAMTMHAAFNAISIAATFALG